MTNAILHKYKQMLGTTFIPASTKQHAQDNKFSEVFEKITARVYKGKLFEFSNKKILLENPNFFLKKS